MIPEIVFSIVVFGIMVLICYPFVRVFLKKHTKKMEKLVTPEVFKELKEKEEETEEKIDKEYKEVQDARRKTEDKRLTDRQERIKRRDEKRKRELEESELRANKESGAIEEINNQTGGSEPNVREGVQIPDSGITGSINQSSDASSEILPSENESEGSEERIEYELVEDDDDTFS